MDALTALLDGPKARGAFLLKSVFNPPWSMRVEDRAPISLVTLTRGRAWVIPARGGATPLGVGDVAVLRGPDPYTLADAQNTPARIVVGPGQQCSTVDGAEVTESTVLGVRTWGETPGPDAAVLLSGTYQAPGAVGRRLLNALPALLVSPAGPGTAALVSLLADEIDREEPGQELVLDRLLDLLFVTVLRAWLAGPGIGVPAWYRAQSDPLVGPALRLLHEHPARPWSVQSLAREVGVSRASLARHFSEVVGEPPMSYLANWRLTLAADLLRDPDLTVAAVAQRVGYGNAFAFKRIRGMSPTEYRARPAPTGPHSAGTAPGTVILPG